MVRPSRSPFRHEGTSPVASMPPRRDVERLSRPELRSHRLDFSNVVARGTASDPQMRSRSPKSVRKKRSEGTPYAELGLGDETLTDDALVDAMMAHPIMINRPLVVTPIGVKLCRPSEAVLDILPGPQRGALAKEYGEQVVNADGTRFPIVVNELVLLRHSGVSRAHGTPVSPAHSHAVPLVAAARHAVTAAPGTHTDAAASAGTGSGAVCRASADAAAPGGRGA